MPKKNNQSRRRKNAGKHVEDRKEADDVASESSDEEVVQPPPPPSPPQREVVDSDDSEYSDEDSEDSDSDADTALKQVEHEPFVDPPMSAERKAFILLGWPRICCVFGRGYASTFLWPRPKSRHGWRHGGPAPWSIVCYILPLAPDVQALLQRRRGSMAIGIPWCRLFGSHDWRHVRRRCKVLPLQLPPASEFVSL